MPNKVNKGKEIKSNSDVFEVYLGTFIDNAFTWYSVAKYKDLKSAYKGFKNYVNTQLKYTDEELQKVWDTGRLDIELRQGNKLLNWVGIYSRKVASLDEKEEKEVEKGKIKKNEKKKKDSVPMKRFNRRVVLENSNALGINLDSSDIAGDIWKLIDEQGDPDKEFVDKVYDTVAFLNEKNLISEEDYSDLWFWGLNAEADLEDQKTADPDGDGKVEINDDESDDDLLQQCLDVASQLICSLDMNEQGGREKTAEINSDINFKVTLQNIGGSRFTDYLYHFDINFDCDGGVEGAKKIYGEEFVAQLIQGVDDTFKSLLDDLYNYSKVTIKKYTARIDCVEEFEL